MGSLTKDALQPKEWKERGGSSNEWIFMRITEAGDAGDTGDVGDAGCVVGELGVVLTII